jgi:hypothetical protein
LSLQIVKTSASINVSTLPPEFIAHYLETICRMTQGYFFCIGMLGAKGVEKLAGQRKDMRVVEALVSGWNAHKSGNWNDIEALYRVGGWSRLDLVNSGMELATPAATVGYAYLVYVRSALLKVP